MATFCGSPRQRGHTSSVVSSLQMGQCMVAKYLPKVPCKQQQQLGKQLNLNTLSPSISCLSLPVFEEVVLGMFWVVQYTIDERLLQPGIVPDQEPVKPVFQTGSNDSIFSNVTVL